MKWVFQLIKKEQKAPIHRQRDRKRDTVSFQSRFFQSFRLFELYSAWKWNFEHFNLISIKQPMIVCVRITNCLYEFKKIKIKKHFLVSIWFIVDQCILMAFEAFHGSSSWILSSLIYLESKSLLSRNDKILEIVKNYVFFFLSLSASLLCVYSPPSME